MGAGVCFWPGLYPYSSALLGYFWSYLVARGDAIFARCNVDWPDDPRCVDLPNNDARWLNNLLWLWCTKHRSPILRERYTPGYMARTCDMGEGEVQSALRAMADLGLISVTGDDVIVVSGVTNQNSRLEWKVEKIPDTKNPWKTDPKYMWHKAVPVTPLTVPNRKEQEQGKEHRKEQGDLSVSAKPRTRKRHVYSPEFEEWWAVGPKTGTKLEASEEWKLINPDVELQEILHYAVKKQLEWRAAWLLVDKNHCASWKHMCRWLRKETWELELDWPETFGSGKSNLKGAVWNE